MGNLRSIAERAVEFVEKMAKAECRCLPHMKCGPCLARDILKPQEVNVMAKDEYICPECEIGNHSRCTSAHCECPCPA